MTGTVKLWNVADGNLLKTLLIHLDNIRWVTFSPNGRVFASASGDRTIHLWSAEQGKVSVRTVCC
jgi:WD40 repeat protein